MEAVILNLAREASALALAGRKPEARNKFEECLNLVLSRGGETGRFRASFLKDAVLKNHEIMVTIDGEARHLYFPFAVVNRNLPRVLHRIEAVRQLCMSGPVLEASRGQAIWDFGDASSAETNPPIAFCSNSENSHLVADSVFLLNEGYKELRTAVQSAWIPWHERSQIVFWRGSVTGQRRYRPERGKPIDDWRWLQRLHLCDAAATSVLRHRLDVGVVTSSGEDFAQIRDEAWANSVRTAGFVRPRCDKFDFLGYRYLIDIDGNGNAWSGLFSAMLMGATIFKVASPMAFRQWYYDKLIPWENYIPVSADLSDLDDRLEWAFSHPRQCAEMGASIKDIADRMTYESELKRSAITVRQALTVPGCA
jgi:Glycosyl transferase family 90